MHIPTVLLKFIIVLCAEKKSIKILCHWTNWRRRIFNMSEAFTVSSLIDALLDLEDKGWGNTEVVNYEGFNLFEANVENQYDGEVVVIR